MGCRSLCYKLFLVFFCSLAFGQNEQIGDLNTAEINSNSTVNSNNTTSSKTYNGAGSSGMPVPTAVAPSLMSSGNDSCLMSKTAATQFFVFGSSGGLYMQDPECNRRKDAKTLKELGLSIAAVAIMCTDMKTWQAMFTSGTPCPMLVGGRLVVGRAAYLAMKQTPMLYIPNYSGEKDYYDAVLGIGKEQSNEEVIDDGRSISERFRTSTKPR